MSTALNPVQTNVTIGTTAVLGVLPANPTRRGLIVTNNAPLSGTPPAGPSVNISFGGQKLLITSGGVAILPPDPPTATTGIEIPAGQSFTLPPAQTPDVALGAQVNAIASAAATPLTFLEF